MTRRPSNKGSDSIRLRLREAFTPSQPVSDTRKFAGRKELLRTLIRSIEDQQLHVVLYGDRGIGKTSLLHVLEELSRKARYIVRYTSCGEGSDFSDVFRAIASDIPLLFHADYDPTADAIEQGGTLSKLLPTGMLSVSQVSEMFSKVSGTRILIILDEFDRTDFEKFRRPVAELIKNLSDRSIRVQLVIAGVASNLTELIAHIPSIRRNIIGLPLPIMEKNEVRELIKIGEAVSGLKFAAEALEDITMVASGSPYLASLLGQHAGLIAAERGATEVAAQDVSLAVDRTLYEVKLRVSPQSLFFIESLTALHADEHMGELAHAALVHSGRIAQEDVAAAFKTAAPAGSEARRAIEHLIEPIPNDPTGAYHFMEEGAGLYLWMSLAAERLHVTTPAPKESVSV
ncbi:MAG: AAA family ATPase [Sphingobium sp.]